MSSATLGYRLPLLCAGALVLALVGAGCRPLLTPALPQPASTASQLHPPHTLLTPASEATVVAGLPTGAVPGIPGGIIGEFCVRSERRDVLFNLLRPNEFGGGKLIDTGQIYRVAFNAGGLVGPVTEFFDLSERYGPRAVLVDRLVWHSESGQVLVTVGNTTRMDTGGWWAELWLLDAAGRPVKEQAMARDVGPHQLAWSPDGKSLLLESSRLGQGGSVYWLDVETEQAHVLENVRLWTPAGAGGGWLRWSHDGRYAIVESLNLEPDGSLVHTVEIVELSTSPPHVVARRDLPDVLTSAIGPGGLIYLASAEARGRGGSGSPEIGANRWDFARPAGDPVPIGQFHLPVRRLELTRDLVVLPAPSLGDSAAQPEVTIRLAFQAGTDSAIYLLDLGASEPRLRRLTPPGLDVAEFQVAARAVVYRVQVPFDSWAELFERPLDVSEQLHLTPLPETEEQLVWRPGTGGLGALCVATGGCALRRVARALPRATATLKTCRSKRERPTRRSR